jgi:Tfp pilus assembly PilM family ATPase
MAKAVGIEINESRVKLLSVEAGGKKVKILRYHEETIPVDPARPWEEGAAEALRIAFTKSKSSKARVVVSIDSGEAVLREVSLPFREDDKIRRTIHAEMESLIHNHSIEDLVIDYFKTDETEKGSVLLAVAIPNAVLDDRLALCKQAGVDPLFVDLDVGAIFNTLLHTGAIETDEPLLIVYGTPKFTKILFIEKKRPVSIRTIRFSLPSPQSVKQERQEREKAAMWETREVKGPVPIVVLDDHEHAQFGELDFEAQSSLVEILAKEISRFLMATGGSVDPKEIVLCGEYEHDEAAQLLEAATEIPVTTHPILEKIDHPFSADEPDLSARVGVPLGLALKGAGVDALQLDFRKGRFSFQKKFEGVKTTAMVTLELVIVLLAAFALKLYFQAEDLNLAREGRVNMEGEVNSVLDYQNQLYMNVSREEATDRREAFSNMKGLYRETKTASGQESPLEHSALDLWRKTAEASRSFHEKHRGRSAEQLAGADLYLLVTRFLVKQGIRTGKASVTVDVAGVGANEMQIEAFRQEIRRVSPFQAITYKGAISPTKEGMNTFSLQYKKEVR